MSEPSPPTAPRPDLRDLTREELRTFVATLGEPSFRGDQIFRWLWKRGARSFDAMTDLPPALRAKLATTAAIGSVEAARIDVSGDGTRKFLVRLSDLRDVESVLIPEGDRMTLCISSQVGCALACQFCATGTMGLLRNLTPSEIAGQVLLAHEELLARPHGGHPDRDRPITNLVYMGMGEPLHNYDNVLASLRILTDEQGLGYPPRRITVSTVGLVPQMSALGEAIAVNLAVSLHAPNDDVRGSIMPINRKWPMAALLAACREFPLGTRRRITFEYVLLAGVNDQLAHAEELAHALEGLRCKVNLIPWNEHAGAAFTRPTMVAVRAFEQRLMLLGVDTTVRTTRGRDIDAACGQLALSNRGATRA
ncbi:MAG: 23S rRNA (adenine(2503)-C(2))-methyltransferase RlmN [Planctomycetes bacterium]|nr:23S rRNA (adenine(2503)-C(2))-methyltransferase RlmN [Planctomycetota bacterium]